MGTSAARIALTLAFAGLSAALNSQAQFQLLAVGNLDGSRAGSSVDLSGLTQPLENSVPGNLLGGLGSAITYAGNNVFLALPDRGPNAVSYNSRVDDAASYVNGFHT